MRLLLMLVLALLCFSLTACQKKEEVNTEAPAGTTSTTTSSEPSGVNGLSPVATPQGGDASGGGG